MKNLMIILAMFLGACGRETEIIVETPDYPPNLKVYGAQESAKELVEKFRQEGWSRGVPIDTSRVTLYFTKDEITVSEAITTLGACYKPDNQRRTVIINENHWENSDGIKRMVLIFHELGHCILNKDHDDTKLSIMNSKIIPGYEFSAQATDLIDDIFFETGKE
jgi:hypothetical protein